MKVMKYLGALFNEEGTCEGEIDNRIGAASKVIGAMRSEVLEGRELSKGTKMRDFNTRWFLCYCMGVRPEQYTETACMRTDC